MAVHIPQWEATRNRHYSSSVQGRSGRTYATNTEYLFYATQQWPKQILSRHRIGIKRKLHSIIGQRYMERSTRGKRAKEDLQVGISTLNLDREVKEAGT